MSTHTVFLYKNDKNKLRRQVKPMSMGAKLKNCRMKKGWPLQQVADEIDVSKAHVYELELNKVKNPSVETLKKLAKLFDMPLSFFLDDDEDIEFQVMFRDLQKDLADMDKKDREAVEFMVKALKSRKADDKN
jgi:transcriptional regulator with XRE-family HTH domain